MLFNLFVLKFENLKAIRECRLCCLSLSKVINNLSIWESLFNIIVIEMDNSVAIWECLSPDPIAKYDFLLLVEVGPLYLAIIANYLLLNCRVRWIIRVVVLQWELHLKVFLFLIFRLVGLVFILNLMPIFDRIFLVICIYLIWIINFRDCTF